jgi:hypothetical protein
MPRRGGVAGTSAVGWARRGCRKGAEPAPSGSPRIRLAACCCSSLLLPSSSPTGKSCGGGTGPRGAAPGVPKERLRTPEVGLTKPVSDGAAVRIAGLREAALNETCRASASGSCSEPLSVSSDPDAPVADSGRCSSPDIERGRSPPPNSASACGKVNEVTVPSRVNGVGKPPGDPAVGKEDGVACTLVGGADADRGVKCPRVRCR